MLWGGAVAVFAIAKLSAADANSTNTAVGSAPVYVPDMTHASGPLPDGMLAWNSLMLATNAAADQDSVRFTFNFTNVARRMDLLPVTNVIKTAGSVMLTNITVVTNFTPISVTILGVHASCGCTQPQLPPTPWVIPPDGTGEFSATVNLEGMTGMLIKYVTVSTDQGTKDLYMRINVLPPVIPTLSDAERAHDLQIARVDRQAIFKGDCVTCHTKAIQGKYGKPLYDAVCGICHDAAQRASMVPDLHNLKASTSEDFWRTWIAHGKPGSLMPAFSTADGGPLSDMQIATLAAYLNNIIPPHPAPAPANAPPAPALPIVQSNALPLLAPGAK